MIRRYATTLKCGNCVSKIRPLFDAEPTVRRWEVDLESPNRVLTVEGDDVPPGRVAELVSKAGFAVTGEVNQPSATPAAPATTYYPLLLILGYLVGVTGLVELSAGRFEPMRAMSHFMAGFFLVFSFFKLLDVRAFADAYAGYDLVAARSRLYALAYPFVELALGVAYLMHFAPMWTNAVTLVVMLVGTAGVVNALANRRRIRCACLGTVFALPMSTVTLVEDLLMAAMAAGMLVLHP